MNLKAEAEDSKYHLHFSEYCVHGLHERCPDECPVCHRMCVCECHGHEQAEKFSELRHVYVNTIKRAVLVDKKEINDGNTGL